MHCARSLFVSLLSLSSQIQGAFAEYALLDAKATAIRPSSIPPTTAAAFACTGQAALQALRDLSQVPLPGSKDWTGEGKYEGHVLVAAASGGIGHIAAQVLRIVWIVALTVPPMGVV